MRFKWMLSALLCLVVTPSSFAEGPPDGVVARAVFTTDISDREPVDHVVVLPIEQRQIYFFTELVDLQGETVSHVWEHNGKIWAEKGFEVNGPRWRVFSLKSLDPERHQGRWTVWVKDEHGWPLKAKMFVYGEEQPSQ